MQVSARSFGLVFLLSASMSSWAGEGDLVFIDVYGGYAWPSNEDIVYETSIGGARGEVELNDVGIEDKAAFGGRVGFWLRSHPSLGLAIDTTRVDADVDTQTVNGTISSPAVGMGRLPVQAASEMRVVTTFVTFDMIYRMPMGRLTPYITGGVGVAISELDEDFFSLQRSDNTATPVAFKGGAGVSYTLSDSMELFGEYRYMHAAPEYDIKAGVDPATTGTVNQAFGPSTLEKDINVHALLTGISIRF
ncbi:MAG: outer membrane protein [Gammaproteobacteria bacterium]